MVVWFRLSLLLLCWSIFLFDFCSVHFVWGGGGGGGGGEEGA